MSPALGATGLEVTRMGLGMAALGRPAYINLGHAEDLAGHTEVRALEAASHEVLDAAWAAGVRYYDAARSYGKGEAFLASWLRERGIAPGDVTVGSKWGYTYTADWRVDVEEHEVKELTLPNLQRQHAESLDLLGDQLDLYQIHSATLDSGVLDDPDVLDELARLRAGGLAIGLSVSGTGQPETIERAIEVGGFDTVQATWNVLEPSAGPALAAAHEAGMGVIIKEAVANGRLTARGGLAPLEEGARELGVTPDALALAAVLAQPWVDVVLSGAGTVAELESNVTALIVEPSLPALERLATVREDPEEYWGKRAALPWN
jgi:aryl-alcohol dehydrogenase-like predicted oxidoreductase